MRHITHMNESCNTHECVGAAAHGTGGVLQPPSVPQHFMKCCGRLSEKSAQKPVDLI